jgi:hypothetical protein
MSKKTVNALLLLLYVVTFLTPFIPIKIGTVLYGYYFLLSVISYLLVYKLIRIEMQ